MKKISFITIIVFVSIAIFIFFSSLKIDRIYDTKEMVGKPISEIDLDLFHEKKIFNTSELSKNQFTLINFFSSWCGPCRKEHKHLIELSKKKNIKILGINFKDEKTKANEFLNKLGNPYYLIASDQTGKVSINFGVYGIPETILINNDLIIIKKYIGPINQNDVKAILQLTRSQ
tara:strand:+ start:6115 stop:6636 length:522 start_codon:yes stop_codon:yes gene_type:complete